MNDEWGNIFINEWIYWKDINGRCVHRAQETDHVKRFLEIKKTVLLNMPPGCTNRAQPLDVVINKALKNVPKEQLKRHLDENLDNYADGRLTVFDRRVLTTKWLVMLEIGLIKVKI